MNSAPARLRRTGPSRPCARLALIGIACLPVAILGGCGNIQVKPLATGDLERPAYALTGPSLDSLRDEARRLCPGGGDVQRAAQRVEGRHAVQAPAQRWYGRWYQSAHLSLTPEAGEAQLVVVCQPMPGLAKVLPASAAPPMQAVAAGADATKPAPIPAPANALAPVGEARFPTQAAQQRGARPDSTAGAAASRTTDLRAGMTAALPEAAVMTGRAGPAPAVPTGAAPARAPANPQMATPKPGAADASAGALRPARAASAPILSY